MRARIAAISIAIAGCSSAPRAASAPTVLHAVRIESRVDRDGDGVPDVADRCPDEPEDIDGFADDDGCFEADNDRDGFADIADQCPNDAEDRDGFEDDDGCLDPDNDADGIEDVADRCPNEREILNSVEDDDGCPDTATDACLPLPIAYAVPAHGRETILAAEVAQLVDVVRSRAMECDLLFVSEFDGRPGRVQVLSPSAATVIVRRRLERACIVRPPVDPAHPRCIRVRQLAGQLSAAMIRSSFPEAPVAGVAILCANTCM